MNSSCQTRFLFLVLLLISSFSMATLAIAQEQATAQAAIIWQQYRDNQHQVLVTELDGDDWSEAQIISAGESPITTPALAYLSDGGLLAVWGQQAVSGVRLMSARKSHKNSKWSEPRVLYGQGPWNMNPNLIRDRVGDLWLFWTASPDGDSDIYGMKKSKDSDWGAAQIIHANNDIPDYKPQASLSQEGNIQLEWLRLSLGQHQPESLELDIEIVGQSTQRYLNAVDDLRIQDVTRPDFVPRQSNALISFRNNLIRQSMPLD